MKKFTFCTMVPEGDGWIKIADTLGDLPFGPNGIAEVLVENRLVCIAQWKDAFFAFAPQCPHAGARFATGFVDALGNVVCPLHHYKFSLKNGRNVTGEGYCLKRWPLKQEGGIFINFSVV